MKIWPARPVVTSAKSRGMRRKVGDIKHVDPTEFQDGRQIKKGLLSEVREEVCGLPSQRERLQKIRDIISAKNPDLRSHTESPAAGYELETIHGDIDASGRAIHHTFTTGTTTDVQHCDEHFGVNTCGQQISLGPLKCTVDQAAQLVVYIDVTLRTLYGIEVTVIAGETPPNIIWSGESAQYVQLAFTEPIYAATILAAPELLQRVPCIPRGRDTFKSGTETIPRVRHAPAQPENRAPVEGRKVAVSHPCFEWATLSQLKEKFIEFEDSVDSATIESICKGTTAGSDEAVDCEVVQLLLTSAKAAVMLANGTLKLIFDGEPAVCELVASSRELREAQETEVVFFDNAGLFRVGFDESCVQEGVDKAIKEATKQQSTQLLPLPTTRTQLGSNTDRTGSFVRHRPMRSGNMWLARASAAAYDYIAKQEKSQLAIELYHTEAGEVQVTLTLGKFSRRGEKGTGHGRLEHTEAIAVLNSVWEQRLQDIKNRETPQVEPASHRELIDLTSSIKTGIDALQAEVGEIKHSTTETGVGIGALNDKQEATITTLGELSASAAGHLQAIGELHRDCTAGFVSVMTECQGVKAAVNDVAEAQRTHESRMVPLYQSMIDRLLGIEHNTKDSRAEDEARKRARSRTSSRQGERLTHTEEYLQAQLTLLANQQQEQAAKLAQQPPMVQQTTLPTPLQNLQNMQNVQTLASLQSMGIQLPRG
ncbi:hypothetical protein CYMTET_3221 [Cymbomonas tetramitiformis]|uniref:Uncharacterized protein n=1 Tax=Cymbomonas tetramitiformis TaxID=36881 RepID=A0AAE0LLA5_9CHLO|nr:hypothetical protein CYMTET_3221 [Cymbomonas tetramitiformis]